MSDGNSHRSITTLSPGRQSIESATRLTPCATLDGKPMSPGSTSMSAATFEATRAAHRLVQALPGQAGALGAGRAFERGQRRRQHRRLPAGGQVGHVVEVEEV